MALDLPADLTKGDATRTASTPAEYWDLVYKGFAPKGESDLTPQEKAARTRAANKQAAEDSQKPDENPDAQAGDAQTV